MIEIGTVLSLLGPIAKNWTQTKVLLFDPISDVVNEPAFKKRKRAGARFHWVKEGKLRARERDAWKPFYDRDLLKRPRIYMDRKRESLLMVKDHENTT